MLERMPAAPHFDPLILDLRPMLDRLLEQVDALGVKDTRNQVALLHVSALAPIANVAILDRIAVALEQSQATAERTAVALERIATRLSDDLGGTLLELASSNLAATMQRREGEG